MLERLKLVVLGSVIICISSCKDNVQKITSDTISTEVENRILVPKEIASPKRVENKTRQDSIAFLNKIGSDITELMETKNDIDSLIFGDCIHNIVNKAEPQKIRKKDILNNFNLVFDTNFKMSFKEELQIKNFEYFGVYDSQYKSIDNHFNASYIKIAIPEQNSEYDFSRIYWFRDNKGKWCFCGLTCAG